MGEKAEDQREGESDVFSCVHVPQLASKMSQFSIVNSNVKLPPKRMGGAYRGGGERGHKTALIVVQPQKGGWFRIGWVGGGRGFRSGEEGHRSV